MERDGFKIKQGYVNKPEALKYTAEEFYEKLLTKKNQQNKENQSQGGNSGNNNQSQQNEQNSQQNESQNSQSDDHSFWEKAFEDQEQQKDENSSNKEQDNQQKEDKQQSNNKQIKNSNSQWNQQSQNEKLEFEKNREEKRELARKSLEKIKSEGLNESQSAKLGNVGEGKEVVDWKMVLRRYYEKTDTVWSQRRSVAENNYAFRLEEYDVEHSLTQVMIDTSCSVDDELVRHFLRELKPLIKDSDLEVGCFDTRFYGFKKIKSKKDIDNFEIIGRGGTDFDNTIVHFSKDLSVNKIVFTDGYCDMSRTDRYLSNVIWIV